jgi:predicted RND superfamily exporter protein
MKKTILLFTTILLFSCGSRKVQRSKTEDKTHIEMSDISGQKTIDNSVISVIEIDSTSEMLIEPIDTTKEMVVNGKTYKNARIKHKKAVRNKVFDIKKNVVKIERKAVKIDVKREKVSDTKQTEKKASYWFLLWFLLLIPLYYFLRRYRII